MYQQLSRLPVAIYSGNSHFWGARGESKYGWTAQSRWALRETHKPPSNNLVAQWLLVAWCTADITLIISEKDLRLDLDLNKWLVKISGPHTLNNMKTQSNLWFEQFIWLIFLYLSIFNGGDCTFIWPLLVLFWWVLPDGLWRTWAMF